MSQTSRKNWLYRLSLSRPILIPFVLLAITILLRVFDIMVLPFAERWGEAFLHKALGFLLVLAYLWAVGRRVSAIGLHHRQAGKAILIGTTGPVVIYLLAFGLQGSFHGPAASSRRWWSCRSTR